MNLHREIDEELMDPFEQKAHYVVAQSAIDSGWTASVNRINMTRRMSHELMAWSRTDEQKAAMRDVTFAEQIAPYFAETDASAGGTPTDE